MGREYTIRRDVAVRMADGVDLATDIYIPEGEGPFSTLLQRTPYDRADPFGTQFILQMTVLRALDEGFAVVIQDTRGRFGSGGRFDPFVHEAEDGVATVAWIRAQDFSNGLIATYGASYVGATQMLLAMAGAQGHAAMAPFLTTGNYHDQWTYRGGALQLGFVSLWITESLGPIDVESRNLPAEHPARQTLLRLLADPRGAMDRLPVLADDLVELAPYLKDWLGNPTPEAWWDEFSPIAHVKDIRTPALHIAGFNDLFLEGSLASYQALRHHGASEEVRNGQYLIIGPWSHGNIMDWQGDGWLGYIAAAPSIDLVGRQLEFFSAILQGRVPDQPRISYFTSGANVWQTAEEWPPSAAETELFLSANGALVGVAADLEVADTYVSNTLDPVPTTGGATFLPGILLNKNDGPHEQSAVEARQDVLVYRGEVLAEDAEVTGLVQAELWASSSAEDCDWTARLVDVDVDGRAVGIVDGILRSRYRHGSTPTPLKPGDPECFTVVLGHVSHVFRAGHRIGLQVASSNFPRFDRNPQTMTDPVSATAADFVSAEQRVLHGGDRASRLLLPMVR